MARLQKCSTAEGPSNRSAYDVPWYRKCQLATCSHDVTMSAADVDDRTVEVTRSTATAASTNHAAGYRRRARRAKKWPTDIRPVRSISARSTEPMTTPEMVKNSETPR